MESLNEEKESFVDVLSLKGRMGELNEDESRLRQGWTSLMHQVTVFRTSLRTLLGAALLGKVLTLDFRWRGRCFIRAQDRALPLPTQYHLCRTLILREVYGILLKYKIIQSYVGHQSWFTIEDKVVFPIGGFWCFVWAVDSSFPSFVRIRVCLGDNLETHVGWLCLWVSFIFMVFILLRLLRFGLWSSIWCNTKTTRLWKS